MINKTASLEQPLHLTCEKTEAQDTQQVRDRAKAKARDSGSRTGLCSPHQAAHTLGIDPPASFHTTS